MPLVPKWLLEAPLPVKLALLGPMMVVGVVLGIVVNAMMINLGSGNQHLSTNADGFDAWLIWGIVGSGLVLGLGIGAFVYLGVGLGADDFEDEDDAAEGETGLLEL